MKQFAKWTCVAAAPVMMAALGCASAPERGPQLSRRSTAADAQVAIGRVYEQQGGQAKASQIYTKVVQEHPDHVGAYHRLGVLAASKGQYQEAENYLSQAYQLAPNDASLLNDIGYTYYLQKRNHQAEMSLRQALAIDPTHKRAQTNLALVLGHEGRYAESYQLFRRSNSEAKALANLAYVHAQRGETDKAQQLYSRALSLDGELKSAAEALVQLSRQKPNPSQRPEQSQPPAIAQRSLNNVVDYGTTQVAGQVEVPATTSPAVAAKPAKPHAVPSAPRPAAQVASPLFNSPAAHSELSEPAEIAVPVEQVGDPSGGWKAASWK